MATTEETTASSRKETSTDPWTVGGIVALCLLVVSVLCYGGYRIVQNGEATQAKIGEKCNGSKEPFCEAGLECQSRRGILTCQAPDGVPCSKGKGAVECQSGSCAETSSGYVCEAVPLPGPGHHCNAKGLCADDAECNSAGVPDDIEDLSAGVCKAKSPNCGKAGQSCDFGEVCFGTCYQSAEHPVQICSGTWKAFCLNKICDGTCQPEAKIGEKCDGATTSRCAAGLGCHSLPLSQDVFEKTCQAPDGAPCSKGKGAVECRSGYCAATVNGDVCEALPAVGQKCNVEGLCEKHSECSHNANQTGGICKATKGSRCYKDDDPGNKKYDKRSHCLRGLACLKSHKDFICREAREGEQCNGEVKCDGFSRGYKLVCAEAGALGKVCKVHGSPESDIQLAEINMHRLSDRTAATSHSDDLHQSGTMHLKGTRVSAQLAPDFAEVH